MKTDGDGCRFAGRWRTHQRDTVQRRPGQRSHAGPVMQGVQLDDVVLTGACTLSIPLEVVGVPLTGTNVKMISNNKH